MDITYIPMSRGFVYLAAVLDWASRKILAWRVSISMSTDFCVEAVEEAMAKYGKPAIFNTDIGQPVHGRGIHPERARSRMQAVHGRAWRGARASGRLPLRLCNKSTSRAGS